MDNIKGRSKFKNLRILLDSGCRPRILMRGIVQELFPEKIMWYNGKHKPETSQQILRLKYILPYLHLARQISGRLSAMWMTPVGLDMT